MTDPVAERQGSRAGQAPGPKEHGNLPKKDLARSRSLLQKAAGLIPGCSQTFSKGPGQFVQGVAPAWLERGKDAHVWDVDGNQYIDYMLGLGPVILGYDFPAVTEAVVRQAGKGAIFSLPHPLEVEVAELLRRIIPCAEMVRFGKNGSDATSGAVRLARAWTGRDKIACCGYHGWQDWYIATTSRDRGIPASVRKDTLTFSYNDTAGLERLFTEHAGEIAAVIMEPVTTEFPADGFLERVRELTAANGSLLIFDEIITGFRLALGGAQEYCRVVPDLACFGKAMANGYPLSAVVGRREIMELFEEVFFSFTFAGDAIALAAAAATIRTFMEQDVIAVLKRRGTALMERVNRTIAGHGLENVLHCRGYGARSVLHFSAPEGVDPLVLKSLLQQEMIGRSILSPGYHNICFTLTDDDVDATLAAYDEALAVISEALASGEPQRFLAGPPVQPVFRKI